MNKGFVYLIGSGCGKKNLITIKGYEKLTSSDVIVYDDLIDKELLDINEKAIKLYMGKRSGCHSYNQGEITNKIVELAKEGKTVARLKGGDPYVFGRGGEEVEELIKNDIPFEVIPGISSSIAIPELSGIAITQRNISRGFMVVTGHTAKENEEEEMFNSMATFTGTIVILMGLANIEKICNSLIKKGKDENTPVAVLSNGNSVNPYNIRGKLKDISEKVIKEKAKSPAVIVIGNVCDIDLRDKSSYRTLKNKKIALTSSSFYSKRIEEEITKKGGEVITLIETEIKEKDVNIKELLTKDKLFLFTTSNSVRIFFKKITEKKLDIRLLSLSTFGTLGKETAKELEKYNIIADIVPEKNETIEEFIKNRCDKEKEIVVFSPQKAECINNLSKEGYKIEHKALYKMEKKEGEKKETENLSFIVFTNISSVNFFFEEYKKVGENTKVLAIGKKTKEELEKRGVKQIMYSPLSYEKDVIKLIENEV